MTKTELVKAIAKANRITNTRAQMELDSILDTIMDAVANGEDVTITGFGTFKPTTRSRKSCRNPRTGEMMEITAHKSVNFKAGKQFKELMNKK